MRYILNCSSDEVCKRLESGVLGPVEQCLNNSWKADPAYGFYGKVEETQFEMGWFDGLVSPHPRRLMKAHLCGALSDTANGSELNVMFRLGAFVWILPALFAIAFLGLIPGAAESNLQKTFLILYGCGICFAAVMWGIILREARNRNFRELERLLSGCITEKQKSENDPGAVE